MRIPAFARHLMHRRCRWCYRAAWAKAYDRGDAAGYMRGVNETRAYHERREALWRQGINPDQLEDVIRRSAA